MQIILNGKATELEDHSSIADLVKKLMPDAKKIAVELNREIVPRSEYHDRLLQAGDQLEIVHAIGGG